jgi:putative NADH-flavin reductase
MNITIIGASKGVGFETLKRALQRGHKITTLSRSDIQFPANPLWTPIKGNALDKDDLKKSLQNADAVIVTLGTGLSNKPITFFSEFAGLILELHHEERFQVPFIILTGFGAGESRKFIKGLAAKIAFNTLLKNVYKDKTHMEEIIAASDLRWVFVRPGGLTNNSLTEKYRVETRLHKGMKIGFISRADVADYMVKQAENPADSGKYAALLS